MSQHFVHLNVHTDYSLIDGIVKVKPLIKAIGAMGMGACAVTDQDNLFGLVKFHKAAMAGGVKPIVGTSVLVSLRPEAPACRLILLAQNDQGYRNLMTLVSRGYTEGQAKGTPVIDVEWLREAGAGLIVLSGGLEGAVGRALIEGREEEAEALADTLAGLFPNRFYLELTRVGYPGESEYIEAAVDLASRKGLPVVATNAVRFLKREDFEAHEVRVCIHEGTQIDDARRTRRYTREQYLKSPQEMAELFSDIPEALDNAVEIARRCSVSLTLGKSYLPRFPETQGLTESEYLRQLAWSGLEKRLARILDAKTPDYASRRTVYENRLKRELDVIDNMGFPGYFLIVADFIQWSKQNGVPVGPGRGSGAGSLVAYALEITDLDPLPYDLLFERFLNPERVSMPDFDVDFCIEGRDRVIDYVARRYGREKVSQIITYGTMAAKAVIRDVGRVLGHPYGFVDKIAKKVPFEVGITLERALAETDDLRQEYESSEEVKRLIDLARQLEGVTRNVGKHAGGVVIAPSRLSDFSPLYCEPTGEGLVTQYDKDDAESVGLVKFDFLGLRNLTIINWAVQAVNARLTSQGGKPVDILDIPLDDKPTYDLLKACQTTAVFQLESKGMKQLIGRLKPDCFEDVVALVALFRPGPLQSGMVDDFINRKHGYAKLEYPHPSLETILKPTYGVIVYQEQVMQIAQELAGYTLGEADLLRRAMGKKKPEEMAKQREIFTQGATGRGVDPQKATQIFDLMEKFAAYGFNKSHSAAYALIAYQTAWLKAHYPAEFMAAVLSSDMDKTDKVVVFMGEARSMGLQVTPPDINASDRMFRVDDQGRIVYGLEAIKGVGGAALDIILAERRDNGPFRDLFEFFRRVDAGKVNKRVAEALICAGAMDSLGPNRATLMETLPEAINKVKATKGGKSSPGNIGQLFDFEEEVPPGAKDYQLMPEWDERTRLDGERKTLGLYLTGHPIHQYREVLRPIVDGLIADLLEQVSDPAVDAEEDMPAPASRQAEREVTLAGQVMEMTVKTDRRNRKMAFLVLDDSSARIDVALFPEVYARYQHLLSQDKLLVVDGLLGYDDYSGRYRLGVERIRDVSDIRSQTVAELRLKIAHDRFDSSMVAALKDILRPQRGGSCQVVVDYSNQVARAEVVMGKRWKVDIDDTLLQNLKELLGEENVILVYPGQPAPEAKTDDSSAETPEEDNRPEGLKRLRGLCDQFPAEKPKTSPPPRRPAPGNETRGHDERASRLRRAVGTATRTMQ